MLARRSLAVLATLAACGGSREAGSGAGSGARDAAVTPPPSAACRAAVGELRALLDGIVAEGTPELPMPRLVALDRRAERRRPDHLRLIIVDSDRAWASNPGDAVYGGDGADAGDHVDAAALEQRITAVLAAEPPAPGQPIAFRFYVARGIAWSRVVAVAAAAQRAGVIRAEWMFEARTALTAPPGPAFEHIPDLGELVGEQRLRAAERATEAAGLDRNDDGWEERWWHHVLDDLERDGCPVELGPVAHWLWEFEGWRVGSGVPAVAILTRLAAPDDTAAVVIAAPAKARWDDLAHRLAGGPTTPPPLVHFAIGK